MRPRRQTRLQMIPVGVADGAEAEEIGVEEEVEAEDEVVALTKGKLMMILKILKKSRKERCL